MGVLHTLAASRPADGVEQVAGYTELERAGQGRLGIVYRATWKQRRTVALKVLLLDRLDRAGLRRFRRECQLTSRLSGHPHVVTALDVGTTRSGRPYVAMDYFERGSLGDRLAREGPLPIEEVLRAGVEIAGALGAAHAVGILHRDVRPPNILVHAGGGHALADFGIAALTDDRSQWLSPHHAAPEVLQGGRPSVASDVYSLGATLYELLAGRRTGEGPPEIRRQDVPPPLVALIGQAMAGRAEERVPDAFTLADRLRQLQGDPGVAGTEPPPAWQQHRSLPTIEPAPGARPAASAAPSGPAKTRRWAQRVPLGPLVPAAERDDRARARSTPPPEGGLPPAARVPRSGKLPVIAGILLLMLVGWAVELGFHHALDTLRRAPARSDQHATVAPRPPQASAAPTSAVVPASLIDGARPTGLVATDNRTSVVLHWQLGRDEQYPLFVRTAAASGGPPTLTPVPNGTTTTAVGGLDPHAGYCFQVGAVVSFGRPSTVAWSAPLCIRGATAQPGSVSA